MQPYVIRQGDYLTRLAHERGLDAEQVWSHPRNEALRGRRAHMDILSPGDVIYFPDAPRPPCSISARTTNRYRARVPRTVVDLVVRDGAAPLANEPYKIEGVGPTEMSGTTNGEGRLSIQVPVHVREILLTFQDGRLVLPLMIGHMDPIDEPSGMRARLANLGYLPSLASGAAHDDEPLTRAIRAFQQAERLDPTGTLDETTRDALRRVHGS
jgi:hypothetical protein